MQNLRGGDEARNTCAGLYLGSVIAKATCIALLGMHDKDTLAGKGVGERHPEQVRSLSKRSVPYFLATSDVLFGLASGMTIKFFPIFFLKQVALPPIGTNFILAGTPLCVAIMSSLASPIAQLFGKLLLLLLRLFSANSCCCC